MRKPPRRPGDSALWEVPLTLGFTRRQVRATVLWQATTLVSIGLLAGVPIGFVVGNRLWHAVAARLGVSPATAVPLMAVLLTIPAALVLVDVMALITARRPTRRLPAVALAAE